MKNKDILKKVFEKAIKNGYKPYWLGEYWGKNEFIFVIGSDDRWFKVIFSHDFAKALFGEQEDWKCDCGFYGHWDHSCPTPDGMQVQNRMPAWVYHLQEMVVSEDPIKYLEQFLLKEDSKEAQTKEGDK